MLQTWIKARELIISFTCGPGWNVTMFVHNSIGDFFDFIWNPSTRQVVSYAIVPYLSYHDNFADDFPGTPNEDFALIASTSFSVTGYLWHEFCTKSDDGSWLHVYVDGNNVVNKGLNSPLSACQNIWLNEGIHTITVNYFKHTGRWATLEVLMDGSLITFNGKTQ
jgi:hypothetical protein